MYGRDFIANYLSENNNMAAIAADFDVDTTVSPVGRLHDIIQRKELKKTERLSHGVTDIMVFMILKWVKTLGVNSDAVKRQLCLLCGQMKFDPKMLNNLGDRFLNNERIQVITFMLAAYEDFQIKALPNDTNKADKTKVLQSSIDQAKIFIMNNTTNLFISSMAKEVHAMLEINKFVVLFIMNIFA